MILQGYAENTIDWISNVEVLGKIESEKAFSNRKRQLKPIGGIMKADGLQKLILIGHTEGRWKAG